MTPTPPPYSEAQAAALQLLVRLGLLGDTVSHRLLALTTDPELVRHLPVSVIADLAMSGTRRPAEIQQRSGLTSGGVTKLLDRLEAAGIVTRSFGQVPGDRRAIIVSLTPRGAELATGLADTLLAHVAEVRAALEEALVLVERIEAATGRR